MLDTYCGSPPYAAPELFADNCYQGELVDIWAMGVMLYYMLSGVMPFRGETIPQLKARKVCQARFSHASLPVLDSWASHEGDK